MLLRSQRNEQVGQRIRVGSRKVGKALGIGNTEISAYMILLRVLEKRDSWVCLIEGKKETA